MRTPTHSATCPQTAAGWPRRAMLLLWGLLTWAGLSTLHAQVDPNGGQAPYQFEEDEETDKEDSIKRQKVKVHTDFLDIERQMDGHSLHVPAGYRIDDMLYTDAVDRLDGFSMRLGQWGMPYMRFRYGTEASNFDRGYFVNPVTGAEDAYFIDPERGATYFDTRTPYVNAYYGQGNADAGQLRADVSHNINHLVNVALLYRHRQSNGVYANSPTRHDALGVSSNFRSLNERYQVYAHVLLQQHDDGIHGGVIPLEIDSSFFGQGAQPVSLSGANLRRFDRAASIRQFYRITKDSADKKHSLMVYNGYFADYFLNQFTDRDVAADVNNVPFPVYPNLGDSNYVYEKMELRRYKVDAGLTYKLSTPVWKAEQRLELEQEWQQYDKNYVTTHISRSSVIWHGHVHYDPNPRALELRWNYRQTLSNVFRPETYAEWELTYRIPKWQQDYTYALPGPWMSPMDSIHITKTHRPFGFVLRSLSHGRNPTLQQAFGTGWPGNNFVGNPDFSNRRIRHLSLGIELKGKDSWSRIGEQAGNHLRLSAFSTRNYGLIYSEGAGGYIQAAPKQYAGYFGAELDLRLRWKVLFLETRTVFQEFGTNSTPLQTQFERSQPKFYSKTSIFYENRNLKFVNCLRFGLDYWYFNTYDPPYFDPASQTFYAQGDISQNFQFAYPRADVYLAAQVKRAFLFVRMINLLEGLPQLGYYTTMGYPMQVRQLQLGLNWTFFD